MTDKSKDIIRRMLVDARDKCNIVADSAVASADKAGCSRNKRYALIQYAATKRREAADITETLAELDALAELEGVTGYA